MYIRRKVFSLLEDVDGEARYFSTTDFELTDGSEERYYSNKEDKKGMSKAAKVALGTGAGLAAVAGGIYGGKKGGQALVKYAGKYRDKAVKDLMGDELTKAARRATKMEKIGEAMQVPGDYVVRIGKAGKAKVVGAIDSAKKKFASGKKKGGEADKK